MGSTSDIMHFWAPVAAMAVAAAAAATAAVIAMLLPLLRRFASVRPNARSSHRAPTPQGGGLAVIAATLATVAVALLVSSQFHADARLVWVGAAAVVLTILGAADDVATLGVAPRLLIQIIAVAVVMAVLPDDLRFIPALPLTVERFAFLVGGLYFVNAVNFMDGIDWMTVAEVVPLAGGLALLGVLGALPPAAVLLALALCGAMIGFAPFNRPVARLFLGDAGSLPIGLLLLWLLLLLAGSGHPTAALLLPLYYIADTGITILWPAYEGRNDHQRASQSLLPAGLGRRLQRLPDRHARLSPQHPARRARARHGRQPLAHDPDVRAGSRRPAGFYVVADFFAAAAGLTVRRFKRAIFQDDAAGDTDAEDVDPALDEVEKMRIEQRTDDVLHDDDKTDPRDQTAAAEQQQVRDPHRP